MKTVEVKTVEEQAVPVEVTSKKAATFTLAALYAIAVAGSIYLRLFSFSGGGSFQQPYTRIVDSDAARFYRLIELISNNYPSLPMFDPFANFPWGMKEQLPPIWAFLEASFGIAASRLTGLSIPAAAALAPVFFGLLFTIASYYAGKNLFGKRVGHVAALLSLFIPASTLVFFRGMVDHHGADLIVYMTTIALLGSAYGRLKDNRQLTAGVLAVLSGQAIVVGLLISISSILSLAILSLTIFVGNLVLTVDERDRLFKIGAGALVGAGTTLSILYFTTPWFEKSQAFAGLSMFQPIAVWSIACLTVAIRAIDKTLARKRVARVPVFMALYVGIALVVLIIPGFGEQIVRGFYRSIALYPLGRVTTQLASIFGSGGWGVVLLFSPLLVLLPLGPIRVLREGASRLTFPQVLFLIWFGLTAVYFAMVRYYIYLFTPVALLSLAWFIAEPLESIRAILRTPARPSENRTNQTSNQTVGVKTKQRASFAFFVVAILVVATQWSTARSSEGVHNARLEVLEWMRMNTPASPGYEQAVHAPEYGILADWSVGEQVEVIARRATIATGNHETGLRGIVDAYRIFQSNSEQAVVSLMRERRLRYVYLDKEPIAWVGDVRKIGEYGLKPLELVHKATDNELPKDKRAGLMGSRLYKQLGTGDAQRGIEPLGQFRLIKLSERDGKKAVLFELVNGAKLSIKTAPGETVEVSTAINLENGKKSEWRQVRKAGLDGLAEFTLPYPTNSNKYPVNAGIYNVMTAGGSRIFMPIGEDDIARGSIIRLDMIGR